MRVDSVITLQTEELTRRQWTRLFDDLTFVDADKNELAAFDHRSAAGVVVIPRGALDLVPEVEEVTDLRVRPRMPKLSYAKALDTHGFVGQRDAVAKMFEREYGQVRLSTGSGKTSIGLAFVAACATRTLVLVHTKDLMRQWVDRAREEIPGIDVGTIQGQSVEVGHLTVATMQTAISMVLTRKDEWRRLSKKFGAVIIDEGHHAANVSYELILNSLPAYYRFSLSASTKRSDGRQRLVRFNVGPVIYTMPFRSQVPIEVQPVFTNFHSRYNALRWTSLIKELVEDEERNELIARIAEQETMEGDSVLVLSRQIKHLELIAAKFGPEMAGHYAIVTGRMTAKNRAEMIQALRDGTLRAILGTQLFEEGVDIPRLNRVVLAFPGTDVTTLQKVGRVSRSFDGKELALAVDVVDPRVSVLARQYAERKHWYKRVARIPMRKAIDERRYANGKAEVEERRPRRRLRVARPSWRRSA